MKQLIVLFALVFSFCSFTASASPQDTTSVAVSVGSYKFAPINLKDAVTGNYITATFSNVVISNNNPEIATVSNPTAPTTIKVTGVAPGSGTATVSCTATYTDPGDGLQKTENKTIVLSYTVIGTPHGATLSLAFN